MSPQSRRIRTEFLNVKNGIVLKKMDLLIFGVINETGPAVRACIVTESNLFVLCAFERSLDLCFRFGLVAPANNLDPFAWFQFFITLKEMLDLRF